ADGIEREVCTIPRHEDSSTEIVPRDRVSVARGDEESDARRRDHVPGHVVLERTPLRVPPAPAPDPDRLARACVDPVVLEVEAESVDCTDPAGPVERLDRVVSDADVPAGGERGDRP